jgi:LytS/YehU family sensor histidine kinase
MLYFLNTQKLDTSWVHSKKYVIPYLTAIITLVIGMQIIYKTEVGEDNFWVIDGDIWLMDVFGVLFTIGIFFFIFSWTFEQWKKIQALKNAKSKAELLLLKNQINPHFFFNTLNKLYSLIKKDPDAAQDYVLKLSDLMRFTIYDSGKETVILEDEIKYLNNFIELQTARYHRDIEIEFNQNIKNSNTKIPPLIFIILLENAFKHGVEKAMTDSFIHINLIEDNLKISFEITNNFEEEQDSKKIGIGLINLKERLNLLYPNEHQFITEIHNNTFTATLELYKK